MIQHSITPETDLVARDLALLVQIANNYVGNSITIHKDGHQVNAKSILGMFALKIEKGQCLMLSVDGRESNQVVTAIEKFFSNLKYSETM